MSYGAPQPMYPPKPAAGGGGKTVLIIVIAVLGAVVLLSAICVVGLAAALLPAVSSARGAAQKVVSGNNLKQISMAILNYHDANGSLPPPFLKDPATGQPSQSWRVMILPFLEQGNVYTMYDQKSPWNAPSNQAVRSARIRTFESPFAGDKTPGKTNYVVVVGPQTAFPPDKKMKMTDLLDGTSTTIFVLEIANSNIEWSEPRDLDFNSLTFSKTAPPGTPNVVVGGAMVAFGDGAVKPLARELTTEQLKAMATATGGEMVIDF